MLFSKCSNLFNFSSFLPKVWKVKEKFENEMIMKWDGLCDLPKVSVFGILFK